MRLVVIDLIPALLSWEGRDASDVAADADTTLQDLYDAGYRLEGVADSERSGSDLRDVLAAHGLAEWFERVASSAEFGPLVTPRVIRRIATSAGVSISDVAVVTAREPLAKRLQKDRIAVVLTGGPEEFWAVPEALADLGAGHRP
ncbi:MAG TPA: hypothetical protein VLD62_07825 [Acidimicrobiia bacterium]|nr:hypothetical protein [Acidimicrobiia bacterium]